ncbi:MAG TPA: hypothetical protein VHZ55_00920 [Bryobacteraceae bacterium]|nr:hypothetical protein [Bryobacteraceae bacterium]
MHRRRFLQTGLAATLAAPVFSQSTPDNKGKEVVASAIEGLGGSNFLQMRTRVASGRVYAFFHDNLSNLDLATIYTQYSATKPAKGLALQEREVLGKKHDYSYLFLADQGWDVTFRGARPIPDESWQNYVRSTETNVLYLLRARQGEAGMDFDYIGSDVFVSRHVEIVEITDSQGRTIRVYLEHNTRLPMRQTYTWLDEQTRERNEEVTVFDKYRDIGEGIMWPYSIEREKNGYKVYQLFAEKMEANVDIPPKMFELPPGAKVLKRVD